MSPILGAAFEEQKRLREEFRALRTQQYIAAETATNGALLNQKGRRARIDPMRLFESNAAFAYCYASEELIDWWHSHPRMTFPEYERQMYDSVPHEFDFDERMFEEHPETARSDEQTTPW
ncbi:hypothetical protein [Microbacterium enclense]|uniref:hypothetical protein n=1 Tax=Microbacterium enclense TaxID=993073 RepID=UPI003F7EB0DE